MSLPYSCSSGLALDPSPQAVHSLVVPATCQVSSAIWLSSGESEVFGDVLMGMHQEVVPLNEEVEGGGQEFEKLGGAFINIWIWVSGACRGQ